MKDLNENSIVGSVVADDYRTSNVFIKYGIDFCCQGNRSVADACKAENLNTNEVIDALKQQLENPSAGATADYESWPLDFLAQHIVQKHHKYVTEKIPVIKGLLEKIVQVHGAKHPELKQIATLFDISAGEFTMHMKKEELMLFPFIRKMVITKETNGELPVAHFGTVENPVRMMMQDHDGEGERFREIAALSNNYMPPADACNTYTTTYKSLKEFEEDLHLHIHLENNILFPKAIALEKEFSKNK
ncbi:iron-sulfur cluster repair di-iron protein [Arachidicoccus sp.]|jgi:regulator of cell morphogenesis and NO signaling|uniref:iron-sulfur cluster repair di-iron protein n=1 Tax=Arachidicoccus sp. TaxID=1872624 RepID=UPI003D1A60CB